MAALAVLIFHTYICGQNPDWFPAGTRAFDGVSQYGWIGVDYFFCLSGFIIAWVHGQDIGRPEKAGIFLRKRFVRIYPAYGFLILAELAVRLATDRPGHSPVPLLVRSFYGIFLLPSHGLVGSFQLIGVSWTLTYEVLFYFLFCGAIILGARTARTIGGIWIAAIVVYNILRSPGQEPSLCDFVFSPFHLEFLAGMLAAHLAREKDRNWVVWIWLGAAGLAWASTLCPLPPATGNLVGVAVKASLLSLLIFGMAKMETIWPVRIPAPLVFLGGASYSIYLVHQEFLNTWCNANHHWGWFGKTDASIQWGLALGAAAALLVGIVYHLAVERPLLTWGKRHLLTPPRAD